MIEWILCTIDTILSTLEGIVLSLQFNVSLELGHMGPTVSQNGLDFEKRKKSRKKERKKEKKKERKKERKKIWQKKR